MDKKDLKDKYNIVNSGTDKYPFYQILMKDGTELCATDELSKALTILSSVNTRPQISDEEKNTHNLDILNLGACLNCGGINLLNNDCRTHAVQTEEVSEIDINDLSQKIINRLRQSDKLKGASGAIYVVRDVLKNYTTPSNTELVEALEEVRLQVGILAHNWNYGEKIFMPKVIQALAHRKEEKK